LLLSILVHFWYTFFGGKDMERHEFAFSTDSMAEFSAANK